MRENKLIHCTILWRKVKSTENRCQPKRGGESQRSSPRDTLGNEPCFHHAGGIIDREVVFLMVNDLSYQCLCIEDVITSNILVTALSF